MYRFSKQEHEKLLKENISKTYKKAPPKLEHSINLEAKNISKTLKIEDRVECIAKTEAFITLKDHKENFQNKLPCRLIVPSKSELGHVSKTHLDRINTEIRQKLNLNQWKNTTEVITSFSKINEKQKCSFIQLDIKEFYPSITKTIFDDALNFAKMITPITREEIRTIKHCRKSLLFSGNETWVKKNSNNSFDVTMGSYDGAEICELVGLYILDELSKKLNKNDLGLYRDDGLILLRNKNGHEIHKIRKQIINVFKIIGFQIILLIKLNPLSTKKKKIYQY